MKQLPHSAATLLQRGTLLLIASRRAAERATVTTCFQKAALITTSGPRRPMADVASASGDAGEGGRRRRVAEMAARLGAHPRAPTGREAAAHSKRPACREIDLSSLQTRPCHTLSNLLKIFRVLKFFKTMGFEFSGDTRAGQQSGAVAETLSEAPPRIPPRTPPRTLSTFGG